MLIGDERWNVAPENISISQDAVHVWRTSLDLPTEQILQLRSLLSVDEQDRADRFHFERHRRRFIAAHGQLRTILARYLTADPRNIVFSYGPRGKPSIIGPSHEIKFNLSHAEEVALVGVAWRREVGIDIEQIHELEADQLAGRFFSVRENEVFRAIPRESRLAAFFRCWTRKEAYIKATGDGLYRPTDSFDVSFAEGDPPQLLSVDGDFTEAARWLLQAFTPLPGFVAAIVVEGHDWTLSFYEARAYPVAL